jgi:hypothetical protein
MIQKWEMSQPKILGLTSPGDLGDLGFLVVPACPRQSLSFGENFNQSMEGVKLPCGVHSCSVVTARVTGKNMENICSSKEMTKVLFNIS